MIDADGLALDYKNLRDRLNDGLEGADISSLSALNFQQPRYNVFTKTLETPQGRITYKYFNPDTYDSITSDWILISGATKASDDVDLSDPATIDHLDYAIYGQEKWTNVPGAVVTLEIDRPVLVILHAQASVIVPTNGTIARTHNLEVATGSDNVQVPSRARLAGIEVKDMVGVMEAVRSNHFAEAPVFLRSTSINGHIDGEPKVSPSGGIPNYPQWARRRLDSHIQDGSLTANLDKVRSSYGLQIDPRADRVYIAHYVLMVEEIYL